MIGIVNYKAGNITSVERALNFLDVQFKTSGDAAVLQGCDALIFPGVGDAKYAMEQLASCGLDVFLKEYIAAGKRVLGICLGSQIIFSHCEEGDTTALGLVAGKVVHLSHLFSPSQHKIPHMGWNDLIYSNGGSSLFSGIPEHSDFYFVHSHYIVPSDLSVVKAYCDYGGKVPACIEYHNITAVQFHPEKSGKVGLRLLQNFAEGVC